MKMTLSKSALVAAVFCAFSAIWIWCGNVSDAVALKPGEVSLVAEMNAGYRAIAAMDPDERVRNPDYMAQRLLPPNFWVLGPLLPDYKRSRMFIKVYRVNRYFTANALTRHIDGALERMEASGVTQVVNIGAGFDSRAYRFAKQMPKVKFFELDQPATLNAKMKRVKAVTGGLPRQVTYIPIDNRTQTVFKALKGAGYREDKKTLFIWESTSCFTERNVADQTLRSIARHAAIGSEVIFDYIVDEVVRGDYSRYRGARFAAVRLTANGEPWRFGIPEDQAEMFVTERGLKLISELGPKELANKYLVRSNGKIDGKPISWCRLIHARVER